MTVAAETLTLDEYLRTMEPWAARTIARSVRNKHALLQREDLLQEAKLTLVEIWTKYADRVPEMDLRKMGTRSVFFHVGNLYYRASAQSRGGAIRNVSLYNNHGSASDTGQGDDGSTILDALVARAGGRRDALDGVILMEAVERVAAESDEARAVLASVLDVSDNRPAGPLDGAAFRRVQKRVRALLYADGYRSHEASDTETEGDMKIETPDEQTGAETAEPKAAKAKKAPKAKPAQAKKATADDTKAASEKFKKDQQVTYKGGARAAWLKAGSTLKVLGTVVSRGRTYVRCHSESQKKGVTLSASHLSK